jgi:iron(III) transport system permease protein
VTRTASGRSTRTAAKGGLRGFGVLAWLPALLVVAIPGWLLARAVEGGELELLFSGQTGSLLLTSVGLAALVAAGALLLGVSTAYLTARTDLPFRRVFTVLLALPLAIPSYMGAFALLALFGPGGILSDLLETRVGQIDGFVGTSLALTLLAFPYVFLPVRAALLGVDPRLEESARTLGLSPAQTFRRVTLPLVTPAIVGGVLMVALYTLSDFGAVSLLQVDTFARAIYTQYDGFNRGGAASLALVLVVMTVLLIAIATVMGRAKARYTSKRVGARTSARAGLGRWRWAAFAWCAIVVTAALGLPVFATLYLAIDGGSACPACTPLTELGANSLLEGALTAGTTLLLVFPVVYVAVFSKRRWRALPDRIIYGGFALPGIVVALALVFLAHRIPALYQTLPLLVLACAIRFLPQAADALRPSMSQIRPSLHEASRTLGRSAFETLRRVTLPLVRSGWLAGGALVFLTTIKELPATLLLRPTGFETLATELWDLTNEGYLAEASVRCLLIVALAVIPMAWLVARETGRTTASTQPPAQEKRS